MKSIYSIFIFKLLLSKYLSIVHHSPGFDFSYFVVRWPGALCDTKESCCYPTTGKHPADFGIHGLWPNYNDGSYPSSCDSDNLFDKTQISDLISSMQKNWPSLSCPSSDSYTFWAHEWDKHGTCSESELDQKQYFEANLKLKEKANLLQILKDAGIEANDGFYSLNNVTNVIRNGVGFTPGIECNMDSDGNSQLFQIYLCVDTSGSEFIKCPILHKQTCESSIQFPKF